MREGISQFMDDAAGNASLTVQDSIIVASLTSITGKDSQRIKDVFLDSGKTVVLSSLPVSCIYADTAMPILAIFAEDQRIPQKVFSIMYAASMLASGEHANTTTPKPVVMKRWLSTLVKRSLFMELVRGSISIHDSKPAPTILGASLLTMHVLCISIGMQLFGTTLWQYGAARSWWHCSGRS